MYTTPTTLGLKRSFGFGDRLGLAGEGHIASSIGKGFLCILAQQSIRELTRTNRKPEDVMNAAKKAVVAMDFKEPWGADADHLKTTADVDLMAGNGYKFFTIDPSEFVNNAADTLKEADLTEAVDDYYASADVDTGLFEDLYLGKSFQIGDGLGDLSFSKEDLQRAIVKYAAAIDHCEMMAKHITSVCKEGEYEMEVSVDETDSPTTSVEHLFWALELQRREIRIVSLAPRFIGHFEKGIDYKGDLKAFEESLKIHVGISKTYGPYKISIHSGSDKFSVYPIIGRLCGDLLHVKTAGTSYLEALRCVSRMDSGLFQQICHFSLERYKVDRASYHVSVTDSFLTNGLGDLSALEERFLNHNEGRQVLHVAFGSVLTDEIFHPKIIETLVQNKDLHKELLISHLSKHLDFLNAG